MSARRGIVYDESMPWAAACRAVLSLSACCSMTVGMILPDVSGLQATTLSLHNLAVGRSIVHDHYWALHHGRAWHAWLLSSPEGHAWLLSALILAVISRTVTSAWVTLIMHVVAMVGHKIRMDGSMVFYELLKR